MSNVGRTQELLYVMSLFCVDRYYPPVTSVHTDLITCQQSQSVPGPTGRRTLTGLVLTCIINNIRQDTENAMRSTDKHDIR